MSPALHVHSRQEPTPPRAAERTTPKQRPLVLGSLVAAAPAAGNLEGVRRPVRAR